MPNKKQPEIKTGTYRVENGVYKPIYYVRESAAQSIVADIFTFGIIIGMTTLNFTVWGGHWYMGILIIFLWLVFVMGRAKSKIREFENRSALIDHLIAELEAEDKHKGGTAK